VRAPPAGLERGFVRDEVTETMPLEHLDIDALLLAYLAGELADDERARVGHMLAADRSLGTRLDALRAAFADVDAALRAADAAEPLAVPASASARRFGRAIRARQARDAAAPPAGRAAAHDQPARRRFRIPGWAYPIATAAAVVLAYTAWWRIQPAVDRFAGRAPAGFPTEMPEGMEHPTVPPTALADRYAPDIGAWVTPNALVDEDEQDTEFVLADTEAELYALSDPIVGDGDDDDVPATFLLGEFE
jgi:hypothetical protein